MPQGLRRGTCRRVAYGGARALISGIEVHHFLPYDAPMPTNNPRLTITLPAGTAAQLRELSALTGNSQSSLISELLEGSGPVFSRVILVLQAAKDAKESIRGKLAVDLAGAEKRIEAQLGLALGTFDEYTGSLLDEAERVRGRAAGAGGMRKRAPASVATPLSNRGVRSTKTQAKTRGKKHGPI